MGDKRNSTATGKGKETGRRAKQDGGSGSRGGKGYKRSDSKYERRPVETKRSNPHYEYALEDATAEEKTLIKTGTITDRINCLALLCARNPSVANYKQLLFFAENQRNNVMYLVLTNVRDLVKEKMVEDTYIRGRIVKTFERGLKNQYIKEKVIEMVGVLIRAGVYVEEMISILVERLLEKDNALKLVETELRRVVLRHEELVVADIEDFYYKNDNFRTQYVILRFLSGVDLPSPTRLFGFYDQALTTLDSDYPREQYNLMLDLIINGLSRSAKEGDAVERIDLVRSFVGSAKTVISCLRLLKRLGDSFLHTYILRAIKSAVLRCTPYECDLLNIIAEIEDKAFIAKLVNNAFYHSAQFIISMILIASSKEVAPTGMFCLAIFTRHYHPAVRDAAIKLLRSEPLALYDPYDRVLLDSITAMY